VSLKILLADDAPAVRKGVRGLLETEGFEVVGEAADGREAVLLAQALDPEMAILDLSMPTLSGLDAAREIRALCPRTRMILLTGDCRIYQIATALRVGIRGYVVKADIPEDLLRAIREVTRGGIFLSLSASRVLIEAYLSETACPRPCARVVERTER
jgi:two-component system, NarL family, response regulator NreC